MKLSELSGQPFDPDPDIQGLTADSREVEKGFLFAALPGAEIDGREFILQAEENGAAAVLGLPIANKKLTMPKRIEKTPSYLFNQNNWK